MFQHLLLLLQNRRRSSHLSQFILENSILIGGSVNAFRLNEMLLSRLCVLCYFEFLTLLLLEQVAVLLKSDLRFSQRVMILLSDVKRFMSNDILFFILLSPHSILILLYSSSDQLLVIALISLAFILIRDLLRHYLMNTVLRVFLFR